MSSLTAWRPPPPGRFGRVAVLMGGPSGERVISLESGTAVHRALLESGVDAVAVDWRDDVIDALRASGCERVFIALHGRGGEDGQIQGTLQTLGLPYTGSGVLASALAMDKSRTKRIWSDAGLPTPDWQVVAAPRTGAPVAQSTAEALAGRLGLPFMVKPAHEGSSLGVSKVKTLAQYAPALAAAEALDPLVMAERFVDGGEYTVPLLQGEALPVIRLETAREFYDYTAKYDDDAGTRYLCPCGLAPEREAALQALALQAFEALQGFGWGRVDMMLDAALQPWLIEANTVPGMTSHSLVPMAARAAGIGFAELCLRILESSLAPRG